MNNPNYCAIDEIAHIKMQPIFSPVVSISPLTEEEIRALRTFCEMWSLIWEHGQADANVGSIMQNTYRLCAHLPLST